MTGAGSLCSKADNNISITFKKYPTSLIAELETSKSIMSDPSLKLFTQRSSLAKSAGMIPFADGTISPDILIFTGTVP